MYANVVAYSQTSCSPSLCEDSQAKRYTVPLLGATRQLVAACLALVCARSRSLLL